MAEPVVEINQELWRKLHHWVARGGAHECSGMGKVVIEGNRLKVIDAWMVKQVNSGAETEMDADDFARIMFQKRDVPGAWYFWWHSHNHMSCFWSGTDRDAITKLANNGACVALVLNTRGEHKCLVASGKPFLLFKDDVKVEIPNLISPELKAAWDKEYDEKVVAKTYGPSRWLGESSWDEWEDARWGTESPYLSRYIHPGTTAIGKAAIDRGEPRQTTEDERVAEAKKRLAQIERQVKVLEFQLRDRGEITRACANIIEIQWAKGLELDSEITGMAKLGNSYTIEDCINDTLVILWEEGEVLEQGLAKYELDRIKGNAEIEKNPVGSH